MEKNTKKVNKLKSVEFSERMKAVIETYNNRRKKAFANEVLDDVTNQPADLIHELIIERNSFSFIGIDYEKKAFFDIMFAVSKNYEYEYTPDKMIELFKEIRIVVDNKTKYMDWSTKEDIKANLQVNLIILLE